MAPIPRIEAETKKQDNKGILWKTLSVRSLAMVVKVFSHGGEGL